MKFGHTEVWGFEHAIRGMRNPKESWNKSDSLYCYNETTDEDCKKCPLYNDEKQCGQTIKYQRDTKNPFYVIGENDMKLMQKLIKAGSEHRKFMRQIFVAVDITAPVYWMAEMDTYKVGVTRDSTSMQHKGTAHRYTIDDFEVSEDVKEILRVKEKEFSTLKYPYDTEDFKVYTCENGREYKVFKNGKVFSCAFDLTDSTGRTRHFEEKELLPSLTQNGYFELNIGGRNGERWLLHRLVATVWIPNKDSYETVDHLDGDKGNNSAENLEWVSREENVKREWENYNGFDLQKCYRNWKQSSKVNHVERSEIRELWKSGMTQKEIATLFEVKQAQVSVICRDEKSTSENKELFEHCWYWEQLIDNLNALRDKYIETKDYKYFRLIRQLMSMGYLYKSTFTMNYENIYSMVHQRKHHSLTEWSEAFMEWAKELPYAEDLIFLNQ